MQPSNAQEPDDERNKLQKIVHQTGIDYSALKDPFSAEYRRIREYDLSYMGKINYGAYTGWSYFA